MRALPAGDLMTLYRDDEPPDEDSGWADEYDKLLDSPQGKALLKDLWRLEDYSPQDPDGVVAIGEAEAVETDDDALQAFVQHVYDAGMAYGYGQVFEEERFALRELADELAQQDRVLGVVTSSKTNPDYKGTPVYEIGMGRTPVGYIPNVRRDTSLNPIPREDITGNPIVTPTQAEDTEPQE